MLLLFLTTPLLGTIRNYVKYKEFKLFLFIRTPITYYLLQYFLNEKNHWKILIFERWFFLIYKTLLSIFNNDYYTKKEKYKKKYNIQYK